MNKLTQQILKTLGAIALVALAGYTFWVVRFTIIYLLISAVIAVIGKPIVDFLAGESRFKFRLSRSLAAGITLLLLLSVFAGIMSYFIPALIAELQVLSNVDYERLYQAARLEINDLQEMFLPKQEASESKPILRPGFTELFNLESISNTFTGLLGSLGNLVFALFSILFITFFFLREKYLFRNIILALIPDSMEGKILHVSPVLRNTLGRYFAGILLQITIVTTVVSLGLKFAGFNNTIVIGFFAGLINVIPYLGPIIGASFGLVLGLAQVLGGTAPLELLPAFFSILVVFGIMQVIDNFVLQPIIFSRSIRAHPLEIFIVISFAAAIAGIAGMIVAVPVYSVLRLLASEFLPHLKFVRWLIENKLNDQDKPI